MGAIEKLLTSAVSSGVGKEDLWIQDHLTTLATKLEAKNGTALEFVAIGLELTPVGMHANSNKVQKIHWVNALVEWIQMHHFIYLFIA